MSIPIIFVRHGSIPIRSILFQTSKCGLTRRPSRKVYEYEVIGLFDFLARLLLTTEKCIAKHRIGTFSFSPIYLLT